MPVSYEKRDHIGIVTLSRPEARNAWGPDFNEGIARHFAAMEDDDDIRCAILTGDDTRRRLLRGGQPQESEDPHDGVARRLIKSIAKRKDRPFEVLGNFPKPLIGAVNGYAVGIGCIVTFCCDLLVASEKAEWRLPQAALGILPAYGGAVRLARWVGRGHAMRTGPRLPASRRGGVPHRAGPVAGAARQADGQGARGGGASRRRCRRWPRGWPRSPCSAAWTFRTSPTPRWSTSIASRRSS